ncbi:short chain dehydrogenase [Brevibacillus centrosporus]|uniref:Short chain dehydrogenase n=1 Tax=Brevibacillus centrosporus TaxID=54910 RepID=A0A1I3VPM6_9BACL|nr:short chain dehydrogenase [Brevibacillus centrosporus]
MTVSSRGALGGKGFPDYVASKAGVIGLTRAMAMELRTRQKWRLTLWPQDLRTHP